jgi:molybdenum cofactor cytidylyltransferase
MCGIILAAGASSRMGRDKALLPWPPAVCELAASTGETLLSAAIAALKPFTDFIVVVGGKNADSIESVTAANGAWMVRNPEPERGQFSSLQIGLHEVLIRGCNASMITLVDCPPLSAASLKHLCASFEQAIAMGKWGVVPENSGRRGHPLIASRPLIDAFLAGPVTSNAREIKRAHAELISPVPVADSLVGVDVDTQEEYAALSGADWIQL